MFKALKVLIALSVLMAAACSEPRTPALRVGTNLWIGYEPLYLARELAYMDDDKIRLVEYTSTSQALKAYRNGLLDAVAVTLDEAIALLDTGERVKVVLVMDISNGADVLLGDPLINDISAIKGKRIGFEHTALGTYFVSRALEVNQINQNDVYLVPLEVDQHERAFLEQQVDVVATFEPIRSRLLASGAKVLFDSSQIPGEIVDVLIVNGEKLLSHKDHIKHLNDAWFKALKQIKNNPVAVSEILDKRMKIGSENIIKSLEGIKFPDQKLNKQMLFGRPEPAMLSTSRKLSQAMYDNKLISAFVETDQLFTEQ